MYMKTRVTKYRIVFKISFFSFIGNIIDACTNNPLCNDSIKDSSHRYIRRRGNYCPWLPAWIHSRSVDIVWHNSCIRTNQIDGFFDDNILFTLSPAHINGVANISSINCFLNRAIILTCVRINDGPNCKWLGYQ